MTRTQLVCYANIDAIVSGQGANQSERILHIRFQQHSIKQIK